MRVPTGQELLDVWERGLAVAPVQHGVELLAVACPETTAETLADLSIGRRDGMLLSLREMLFGPRLDCLIACAACGETLETSLTTRELRAADPAPADAELEVKRAGYDVRLRLLNSRDLIAADRAGAAESRRILFARSVVSATRDGRPAAADELPAEIAEAAAATIAKADPQADMRLDLSCPACGHRWQAPFDIVAYLWAELGAWAARVLREVHVLASAYGWSERDILALAPGRRRHYLSMVEPWQTS